MFFLNTLFCWVPRRRKEPAAESGKENGKRRGRRRRHIHAKAATLATSLSVRTATGGEAPPDSQGISPLSDRLSQAFSEDDYHDAVEELEAHASGRHSVDGSHVSSPRSGQSQDTDPASQQQQQQQELLGLATRLSSWWEGLKVVGGGGAGGGFAANGYSAGDEATPRAPGCSPNPPGVPPDGILEPSPPENKSGCISLFTASNVAVAHKRFLRTIKPPAGSSFRRKKSGEGEQATAAAWAEADGATFQVRTLNYMRSKVKGPSGPCIYRLLGVDVYSFDFKLYHIAQHVQLPEAPQPGPAALALPRDQQLPPLLIINLQLPWYPPSLFGSNDGKGHSLVYYFALPEGWEPSQVSNEAALALAQRFLNNKREFDGTPSRDRLKLVPRIVNPDQWAKEGPLTGYEHRLLNNYNDKPLLTRPQQRFYTGPNYLEIDLDVHNYAFIARRAFHGFIHRLAPVIFENAFVVQGNRPEELPETVLAAGRIYRVDFDRARPFPARSLDELGNGTGPAQDGEAQR